MSPATLSTMSLYRFKVVMLGAPSVGKSSLVRRFVHSMFDDSYKSTLGAKVERKSVEINDKSVNLLLWDIHGETDGLTVTPSYLQGAHAAILVFDSLRPETMHMSVELGVRVLTESPEAKVYLVANKSDLAIELDVKLDIEEWEKLAQRSITQTSAKTGDGVEDLFIRIATEAIG